MEVKCMAYIVMIETFYRENYGKVIMSYSLIYSTHTSVILKRYIERDTHTYIICIGACTIVYGLHCTDVNYKYPLSWCQRFSTDIKTHIVYPVALALFKNIF
jgi:hypothetical protein